MVAFGFCGDENEKALQADSATRNLAPHIQKLIAAARQQMGVTTSYNPAYQIIPYPLGDVPLNEGVYRCHYSCVSFFGY